MGVNSFISLFGIKQEKEKTVLPVSLLLNQKGEGSAQKIFSKLLVKILGFSLSNKSEAPVIDQSKSPSHLPAHVLKHMSALDEAISQKDFLLKLAMGSLHPISFDKPEITSEAPKALPQKPEETAKQASILLPGGIKISAEALLKHLLKNPKWIQKIVVTGSPKESNKKGTKESESVFLAIPVSILEKQLTASEKKTGVSEENDIRLNDRALKKEKVPDELLLSLEAKNTGEKESGKTTKSGRIQKAVLLSLSQNGETLILEDKTAGDITNKAAIGNQKKTLLKDAFSWMLLPVSKEIESPTMSATKGKRAKAKAVETIGKTTGEKKISTKIGAVHSGKEATARVTENAEHSGGQVATSKENDESASPSVLQIFKKGGPAKAILLSVDGSVKISGMESVEFASATDSRESVRMKIQEVDIRGGESEKILTQKLPQLMEKANVVKLAANAFPTEPLPDSQIVSGENAIQENGSAKKNAHLTSSGEDKRQGRISERKVSFAPGEKAHESSLSQKNKKGQVLSFPENSETSVSEKSKFTWARGRQLNRVVLEKSEIVDTESGQKGNSNLTKKMNNHKQTNRFEANRVSSISGKSGSDLNQRIQIEMFEDVKPSRKSQWTQGERTEKVRENRSGNVLPENPRGAGMEQKASAKALPQDYPPKQEHVAEEQNVPLARDRESDKNLAKNMKISSIKANEKQSSDGSQNQMAHALKHSNKEATPRPILNSPGSMSEKSLSTSGEKEFVTGKKPAHGNRSTSSKKKVLQKTEPAQKNGINNTISANDFSRLETISQKGKIATPLETPTGSPIPKEILNKLVQSTRLLIQQGSTQMQIQLKPDSLGAIRLLVETVQNQITVKILVNKPKTQHLLEQHIQSLQHSLVQQGFKIEHIQVSLNVQSEPFQQGQSFQNQTRQGGDFRQNQGKNQFTESGNFLNQPNETQQQTRSRRFGYNSVEYVA